MEMVKEDILLAMGEIEISEVKSLPTEENQHDGWFYVLMWLDCRCARYLFKYYSGVFLDEIPFKSVGWVKHIVLPHVSGPHPITEVLTRTKRLTHPKREFLSPDCLPTGTSHLPVFRLELRYYLFLGLKPASVLTQNCTICSSSSQTFKLGLNLYHWIPWVTSLPTHPADLGTCQPS